MDNHKLNYGELYDKLRALGFRQQAVELDGKRGQVFEHQHIPNAMIVLPERDRSELVERFYVGKVLATLQIHDLLPEANPLMR